jgi:uncharacterized protein (TIGR02217 family)
MSFIEIQLDPLVGYGTKGGLNYVSTVVSNPARKETRFAQQSRGYWNLNITFSDKSKAQMQAIQAMYSIVQGKVYGFRVRNYREYYTCTDDGVGGTTTQVAEPITTYGGGTTMQLIHTRHPGVSTAEIVLITKPDLNSAGASSGSGTTPFTLYRDGSGTPWPSASNWVLDVTTGIITFNTNQIGHTFKWKGFWDTPVRFDMDASDIEQSDFNIFNWQDISVMEVQISNA